MSQTLDAGGLRQGRGRAGGAKAHQRGVPIIGAELLSRSGKSGTLDETRTSAPGTHATETRACTQFSDSQSKTNRIAPQLTGPILCVRTFVRGRHIIRLRVWGICFKRKCRIN